MSTFRITAGGVTLKVDDGLADMLERVTREIAGAVIAPMEAQATGIMKRAERRWPDTGRKKSPRATGKSRRAFSIRTTVNIQASGMATIRVSIQNSARSSTGFYYAGAIQSAVAGHGTTLQKFSAVVDGKREDYRIRLKGNVKKPWKVFVTDPTRKQSRKLAEELGDAIAALMGGN